MCANSSQISKIDGQAMECAVREGLKAGAGRLAELFPSRLVIDLLSARQVQMNLR